MFRNLLTLEAGSSFVRTTENSISHALSFKLPVTNVVAQRWLVV